MGLIRRFAGASVPDLDIKLDPNDVRRIQRLLSAVPKSIPKVFSRALNKTATTARKESAQKISKASGVKVNWVRNMIILTPATRTRWVAKLRVSGWKVNAIKYFKSRTRKGQTSFSKPNLPGLEIPESAFIQTMPTGFTGLFERVGFTKYPIRPVYGPSLSQIVTGSQGIINEVYRNARVNLARHVESQVRLVLSRGR